jgi:uncharacterized membrane protein YjdF
MTKAQKKYRLRLFIAYLVIWALLAINPVYREDWLLENILVFAGVPFLIWLDRRTPLSSLSYTLIFLFMVLHTVWISLHLLRNTGRAYGFRLAWTRTQSLRPFCAFPLGIPAHYPAF